MKKILLERLLEIKTLGEIFFINQWKWRAMQIIVHSLEELLKSAYRTLHFYNVTIEDNWPLTLPLNHVGGLQVALRSLLKGLPLVPFLGHLDSSITLLSLVPTQWMKLTSNPQYLPLLKKMKAILIGGAPLGEEYWDKARTSGLPLAPTYGLTEMGSQVAALTPQAFLEGTTSSLKILPGKEVTLLNNRVCVSGEGKMVGYFKNGEILPVEGRILTQDLAQLNGDKLTIKGRQDRMIISGGKKLTQPL